MSLSWEDDFNVEFCNLAQLPDNIVQHMRKAIQVSFQKYGTVLTKSPAMLKRFKAAELQKLVAEGNHERIVNAINYDMFLYTVDRPDPDYMQEATKLASIYDESKYVGTDSNQSVTKLRKPVSDWLRERIYAESAGSDEWWIR